MTGHASEGSFSDLCLTHINKTATLLYFLKAEKKGLVLNVGCGAGLQSKKLIGNGFDVISVDFDLNLLKSAQKVCDKVVWADASHLPFKENKFDYITCIDVLEHLDDDDACISEMRYVVKTTGKLLLSVPMLNYPFVYDPINKIRTWLKIKPLPIGLWAWEHKRLYEEKQILAKINLKFEVIEKRKISSFLVALFENYIPYLFSYKIKLNGGSKIPNFLKDTANIVCKADEKLFIEELGYINLAFKARPI